MRQFEENISSRQEEWELRYLVVEVSLFQYEREHRRFSKIAKFRACEKVILAKFTKLTFTLFLFFSKKWLENIEKYFFGPINYNGNKTAILHSNGPWLFFNLIIFYVSISNFFQ